jgi:hypothetical protein
MIPFCMRRALNSDPSVCRHGGEGKSKGEIRIGQEPADAGLSLFEYYFEVIQILPALTI